jgi:hypothetical protein
MKNIESSMKALVTRVLEKTAPEAAVEFRKKGDQIVHDCLRMEPESLRQKLKETESTAKKSAVRTRGPEVLFSFETLSLGVTMTSILVHLWHERTMVKLAREEEIACDRLRRMWVELLVNHGIPLEKAQQIATEFGADLPEVFLAERRVPATR